MRTQIQKKMKDKILVIDGEHMIHRALHKFDNMKSASGKPSGAVFGFFRIFRSLVFQLTPDKVIITFDNGRAPLRTNLCPGYKGHRVHLGHDLEIFLEQKTSILRGLKALRVPYIYDQDKKLGYEGDDFIAWVTKELSPNNKIIIVSGDKDFIQLIDKNVMVYHPTKLYINSANSLEQMGYTPSECVDYLSLMGDKSDDIPGYRGMGEKKIRKFLDSFGSIDNFLSDPNNSFSGIERDKLEELRCTNKKMIDLNWFIEEGNPTSYDQIESVTKKLNKPIREDIFHQICQEYSMRSLMEPSFIEPIKKLKR